MILAALALVASQPNLGLAAGACHADRPETDLLVAVEGLKDRAGRLRLELYPDNDQDFLADDNLLVQAGKTFARVDVPVPPNGPVTLCIRLPGPGRYSLSLLHDRNGDHRFQAARDGVGFAGNPKLGWSRPKAAAASFAAGEGRNRVAIMLNYLRGVSMRPIP